MSRQCEKRKRYTRALGVFVTLKKMSTVKIFRNDNSVFPVELYTILIFALSATQMLKMTFKL